MASIPAKAADRIRDGLKRFQPILAAAKARDVNESDTVVLVTDLLNDVFGFTLGALLVSESVIDVLRRELRRVTPGLKLESEQIEAALRTEVIKREVLEGDKATAAQRQVSRAANQMLRKRSVETEAEEREKETGESSAGVAG